MKTKIETKVKSPLALKRYLSGLRRAGREGQIVFTNGCFDILHKGHVTYLEKAAALGGILVVALNSNASVRRIKGPKRPINSLADRMAVVAALDSVDFVTWFEEDTPLELIRSLKPQVLVKGGDWTIDQIVGGEEVLSWGGKVRSLRYLKGKSSTQIIERAHQIMNS